MVTYRNYLIDYADTDRRRVYVDGTLVLEGMTEEEYVAYAKAWIDREVDREGMCQVRIDATYGSN
jgi:hypothetical protein